MQYTFVCVVTGGESECGTIEVVTLIEAATLKAAIKQFRAKKYQCVVWCDIEVWHNEKRIDEVDLNSTIALFKSEKRKAT